MKFMTIKDEKDGQTINGKVPYPIWDDFKDLHAIEKRKKGNRKLTQWDFLMKIIRKGKAHWIQKAD